MRPGIVFLFLFFIFANANGQARAFSVGFWNVENLFDTIPSPFHDDSGYTPEGRYKWTGKRYNNKIVNLARVIDDMDLDILGLAEVENEEVVRDLVITLSTDYNYIHYHSRDSRGLDLALLYKGDKFVPEKAGQVASGTTRDFLYVRGELKGHRLDILLCHMPSRMNKKAYREKAFERLAHFADSLISADKDSRLMIAGDFNAAPSDKLYRAYFMDPQGPGFGQGTMYSPFLKDAALGMGSYRYKGKWSLIDNILLSADFHNGSVRSTDCGIFIKDYMMYKEYGKLREPHRTFSSGKYLGGFSDHLPVYVILEITGNATRPWYGR